MQGNTTKIPLMTDNTGLYQTKKTLSDTTVISISEWSAFRATHGNAK